MRELISALRKDPNHPTARKELSEFIPADKIKDLLKIFPLKEMSAAGGGAVAGYTGPLSSSGKKKKQPSMIREQKIDLTLIDEVMELLIERGIVL